MKKSENLSQTRCFQFRLAQKTLRQQLLSSFLIISLIPMGALAVWNQYTTRKALLETASQSLTSAASQTATQLDGFMQANLEVIATEKQLPDLVNYLEKYAQGSITTTEKETALKTLQTLQNKDPIFIASYALLNPDGRNLLDTNTAQQGMSEAERGYFKTALETGEPFVSAVKFSSINGQPYLYFSQSIRSPATGEVIGILRNQYSASILQQLILKNSDLAGDFSFPILLDENHIRLAQSAHIGKETATEHLFKTLVPVSPERLAKLQATLRLPFQAPDLLATDLPEFKAGISQIETGDHYFTAYLTQQKETLYAGVVESTTIKPWIVAFVRPQKLFFQPVNQNTINLIVVGCLTAGCVILLAIRVSNTLSTPMTRLTTVAQQLAKGDWNAQPMVLETEQQSGASEITTLARTFMQMATQLREVFDSLEQRVKERTNKLQEAKQLADQANRAKSHFLANVSHELRTPLNGILGYAQILSRSDTLAKQDLDSIKIIYQCGTHLLTLINDILDLSKIEADKLKLMPVALNLHSLLYGLVEIWRIKAEQKGIEFIYSPSSRLPEGVVSDEKRLRQVLINLLSNAIKFTDRGAVTFTVDVLSLSRTNVLLLFQVMDTGVGVAPADYERIFQAFEQVGDPKKQTEGTGLGLAISQQIINLMGGSIQVKSQLGQGSEFFFTIKLPLTEDWVSQQTSLGGTRIVGYEGKRRQILVVDDQWENRAIIQNLLKPVGFEVIEAKNGQDGLDQLYTNHPDLVITDLTMPVMDGFEFLNHIRNSKKLEQTRVIVSSASVSQATQSMALGQGGDDFLTKPVDACVLFTLIATQLGLTWIYEVEDAVKPDAELLSAKVVPPDHILKALQSCAQEADMQVLRLKLTELTTSEPSYAAFVEPILKLSRQFDVEAIEALLQKYLDEGANHV